MNPPPRVQKILQLGILITFSTGQKIQIQSRVKSWFGFVFLYAETKAWIQISVCKQATMAWDGAGTKFPSKNAAILTLDEDNEDHEEVALVYNNMFRVCTRMPYMLK